jgi:protocatechuate 3,4-dioxygenase beta subunit
MNRNHRLNYISFFMLSAVFAVFLITESTAAETCAPTRPDQLGPFYEPGAPERSRVGKGYVLTGTVKSTKDCTPIKRAKIEFWLTGPDGDYGDDYRATVYSDESGAYSFESSKPKPYFGRPPHIHIRVSAVGFKTLVTQHYPERNMSRDVFDLVLVPADG